MRRSILFLGLLSAAACVISTAQASIVYQYVAADRAGNTGLESNGSNFKLGLATGQQYTLDIYLQETVSTPGESLIAAGGGLKGAGFSFSRQTGTALESFFGNPSDPANGSGPPNDFGGSGTLRTPTNITSSTAGPATGKLTEGYSVTQPTGVTGIVNGLVTKVLLGSVTFTFQGVDSQFTLSSFSSVSNGTTTIYNTVPYGGKTVGLDLDNNSGNTGYTGPAFSGSKDVPFVLLVTSATVPEPSSLILGGFAVFGGGFGYIRRRFGKKQVVA